MAEHKVETSTTKTEEEYEQTDASLSWLVGAAIIAIIVTFVIRIVVNNSDLWKAAAYAAIVLAILALAAAVALLAVSVKGVRDALANKP